MIVTGNHKSHLNSFAGDLECLDLLLSSEHIFLKRKITFKFFKRFDTHKLNSVTLMVQAEIGVPWEFSA